MGWTFRFIFVWRRCNWQFKFKNGRKKGVVMSRRAILQAKRKKLSCQKQYAIMKNQLAVAKEQEKQNEPLKNAIKLLE